MKIKSWNAKRNRIHDSAGLCQIYIHFVIKSKMHLVKLEKKLQKMSSSQVFIFSHFKTNINKSQYWWSNYQKWAHVTKCINYILEPSFENIVGSSMLFYQNLDNVALEI